MTDEPEAMPRRTVASMTRKVNRLQERIDEADEALATWTAHREELLAELASATAHREELVGLHGPDDGKDAKPPRAANWLTPEQVQRAEGLGWTLTFKQRTGNPPVVVATSPTSTRKHYLRIPAHVESFLGDLEARGS